MWMKPAMLVARTHSEVAMVAHMAVLGVPRTGTLRSPYHWTILCNWMQRRLSVVTRWPPGGVVALAASARWVKVDVVVAVCM